MGRKEEACADCLQKCLQIHGKNKNSSTTFSFFKVLIGDQFTKVLYFPPKFAAKMSESIGQTTFVEDSQGRQWKVATKSVNGTLAFEKGWSTFSSAHDLQVGDFLVFNFIVGSHFFVKIFDRSACEKEVSPKNNSSRKRTRSGRFDFAEPKSCGEHDNDASNRPSSSNVEKSSVFSGKDEHHVNKSAKKLTRSERNEGLKPVFSEGLEEELCYVINRGIDYEREGEKSPRANLFDLEMEKNSSETIGIVGAVLDESLPHQLHAPLRTQIHENAMGSGSQPIAENGSKKGSIENSIALEDVGIKVSIHDKDLSIPPALESKGGAEVMKFQTDEVKGNLVSNEIGKIIKERVEMTPGEMGKIIKEERVEVPPVEVGKTIKEELDEMTPGLFEDEENLNIMPNSQNPCTIEREDKEIGLEVRNSVPSEATVSCIVAENRSFLANDIRAGQECVFKVENEAEGRYQVSITKDL